MKYADYLAQQPQEPQEEPQAQQPAQAGPLDAIRAQLDADKYYSLLAAAREAIATEAQPSALAARLTAAIFGPDSPEAGTVSEAIEQAKRPGGYEMAIELARQRRSLYKRQLTQLAEQEKAIAAAMGLADKEERELMDSQAAEGQANVALLAVMQLAREAGADAGAIISQAARLYDQHNGNRPAMGLLYGSITQWQGQHGAGLDLVQQQEMQELKARIAAAAGL